MPHTLRDTCSTPAPMPKQTKVVCAVACGMLHVATAETARQQQSPRLLYLSISIRYILVRLVAVVIAVVGQATTDTDSNLNHVAFSVRS